MPATVRITDGQLAPNGLFPNLLFQVLPPQRRFKWKEQQIDQLWTDVLNAHRGNSEDYFLGPLLLTQLENGRMSVIDGQQRITALSILLAVLRDRCSNYPERAGRVPGIQRLISRVNNEGHPTGDLVIKLQGADDQVYIDIVKENGSTTSSAHKPSLLSKAVNRLNRHVDDYLKGSDPARKLGDLCDYVQDKVMLLPLEIRNEGEGYLVFDTTNTRGLRPSPAETLKARLATIARDRQDLSDELIEGWNSVATLLENAGLRIDAMDDYLRVIWCSKEEHISKGSLHGIATKITIDEIEKFVQDLKFYADSYLAVVAPQGKAWLIEDLKDLRGLNIQSHSFLTMVHKHSHNRFEEAVELVLALQIRNITLGSEQANEYTKNWSTWANLVYKGSTEKAFKEIRDRIVGDEQFRKAFESKTVEKVPTKRHILRRLDPISRPGSGVLPMDVDVEHIMPRAVVDHLSNDKNLTKTDKEWIEDLGYNIPATSIEKRDLGKKLQTYLDMLGNQTLLNDKANSAAKNSPFPKKKPFYQKQALELTKQLIEKEEWGPDEIVARQKEMAELAVSIWRK